MLVGAEARRMLAPIVSVTTLVVTSVAVATAGSGVSAFSCSSGAPTYTVRAGDGWFGIADRLGVARADLLDANTATADDTLVPGDRLCLPDGADLSAACANAYTVAAGDSWFGIASRAGTTGGALLAANGASAEQDLHPGDRICLPDGAAAPSGAAAATAAAPGGASPSGRTYTVAGGDSWFAIATRAEVSLSELLDVNGADPDTVLIPGAQVALPSGAKNPARGGGNRTVTLQALPTQGPCWYADTWMAPRSGGRRHEGVDLFAKHGEYVYAVVDGVLTDRAWDQPGRRAGNAWSLTSADGSGTWFFYAHLADFAPGLKVSSRVRAGQIIGFVGQTGNAAAVHLHFEVHPNDGDPVNPYPIVRTAGGCNRDTPYTQPGGWVPEVRD